MQYHSMQERLLVSLQRVAPAVTAVIPTDKVSENTSLFRKAMILYFYKNKTFETIPYKKTTLLLVPLK
jgi:hypothetical protein